MNNVEHVESLLRERILQDRLYPMEDYDDEDFLEHCVCTKWNVIDQLYITEEPFLKMRNYDYNILPNTQFLVTVRFYATGGFWKLVANLFGIQVCNVS